MFIYRKFKSLQFYYADHITYFKDKIDFYSWQGRYIFIVLEASKGPKKRKGLILFF